MNRRDAGLDPRVWLLWLLAASMPALLGRNPWPLLASCLAVVSVRAAWAPFSAIRAWTGILRLVLIIAAFGVVFNVLTAHGGDTVLFTIPTRVPILGGPLTLNAIVFGLLSGLALTSLVLAGMTAVAVLDWSALLRILPHRLAPLAVAGSVAWNLIPATAIAFGEIREAQAARGFRARGVRGLTPLIVPLLSGGMERALTLAEVLESRGFGARIAAEPASRTRWLESSALVVGLASATTGAYLIATGRVVPAAMALALGGVSLLAGGKKSADLMPSRTRYRRRSWRRVDSLVVIAATLSLVLTLLSLSIDPSGYHYDPYPTISLPRVNLLALIATGLLLAPAAAAPSAEAERS